MNTTILIADDEPNIRDVVRFAAEQAGFHCLEAADGKQALERFAAEGPDLLVLDVKMPHLSGTDVCRQVRAGSRVPIIFLTSCDDEIDRVVGLELGADDYVTKPFSPRELVARMRAVLRRSGADPTHTAVPPQTSTAPAAATSRGRGEALAAPLRHGRLMLDLERFEACWDERPVALTATGFRLLHALLERPGRVLDREQLIERMYTTLTHVSDRTVDSHVRRVRAAFAEVGGAPLETVQGIGYRLGSCE